MKASSERSSDSINIRFIGGKKQESAELSLFNWCLNNRTVGGRILTDWDVLKNAVEGVYINDIAYDTEQEVWLRDGSQVPQKVKICDVIHSVRK